MALKAARPSDELLSKFKELQRSLQTSNQDLSNYANTTENLRQQCLISRIEAKANVRQSNTEACANYALATGNSESTVGSNTELFACVQDLDFQVNSFDVKQEALNNTINEIDDKIERLKQRLILTDVKFSHLAREAQHAADTQDQLDSNWLSFHFNSSNTQTRSAASRSYYSSAYSGRASGWFWSVGASHSYSRSESSFSYKMNTANTVVEGQLLRVTIQRPWFRPSLFKSKQFQIRVSIVLFQSSALATNAKAHVHNYINAL